jgi:hypothetical protein
MNEIRKLPLDAEYSYKLMRVFTEDTPEQVKGMKITIDTYLENIESQRRCAMNKNDKLADKLAFCMKHANPLRQDLIRDVIEVTHAVIVRKAQASKRKRAR